MGQRGSWNQRDKNDSKIVGEFLFRSPLHGEKNWSLRPQYCTRNKREWNILVTLRSFFLEKWCTIFEAGCSSAARRVYYPRLLSEPNSSEMYSLGSAIDFLLNSEVHWQPMERGQRWGNVLPAAAFWTICRRAAAPSLRQENEELLSNQGVKAQNDQLAFQLIQMTEYEGS